MPGDQTYQSGHELHEIERKLRERGAWDDDIEQLLVDIASKRRTYAYRTGYDAGHYDGFALAKRDVHDS